jgi:hypothetical protein
MANGLLIDLKRKINIGKPFSFSIDFSLILTEFNGYISI